MVFLRHRERQQVVELIEMEGGSKEKKRESDDESARGLEPHKKILMEKHIFNSEAIESDLSQSSIENETCTRAYAQDGSCRSSQSSSHSYDPKKKDVHSRSHANLHPHIRLNCSDSGGGVCMPSRSPRFNSHSSLDKERAHPLSKQLDNTRRDAVMSLSEKRERKAELVLQDSMKSKVKTIGLCKITKYSISMSFQKFKEAITSVSYTLELWYSSLKLIEGNFGSGVASYFKFLRWLFLLNLVTLVISFSFLVVPQLLARFFVSTYEVPDVAKNGGTHLEKGFFDAPDLNGTLPPPLTASALLQRSNPYHENEKFSAADLFTGEGFLTDTTLYYGFYKSRTLELFEGYPYDLPNAYFFSMVVCYVTILITVSFSMATLYRKTFIETRGAYQKANLALKIFSGWDFSIATQKAADLNQRHLHNEIKEALNEVEFQYSESSCLSRLYNMIVQLALNVIFFVLMTGVALLMWYLLGRHSAYLGNNSSSLINTMTMAIITSLIMNVLPKGFSWIVKYEDYRNPRTALYATLLRTFLLNVVVIGTISVFWLTHPQECWETSFGQEVYRLLVTDFIISILVMGILETIQSCIQRTYWKENGQTEFDIAWNTLNLIYNQTLFLVGFYFSPLLAAVIVVKFFITFHIKKAGALYNCQAPQKSWRADQTQTLFLILTFIALLGVFLLFGYIIFKVPPSKCGPFHGFPFMYEAILQKIFQLQKDNIFWLAITYVVKPGVVGGLLIAMCIATYILRAKAQAHAIEADILKNMLIGEAKDKAFLFKYMKRIEQMNGKKGSPALSSSSSLHTPLSQRKQLKKASNLKQSSFLQTPHENQRYSPSHRKSCSTSYIASTNWSYDRGSPPAEIANQPSSGSSRTGEVES